MAMKEMEKSSLYEGQRIHRHPYKLPYRKIANASNDSVKNIHSFSHKCCSNLSVQGIEWGLREARAQNQPALTSYSMVRSWPKNNFFAPMPNNMALKRMKLPSIYAHEQVSNKIS